MVRRYECPFCKRRRSSKAVMVGHVKACWHDPANRACLTCKHHLPLGWVSEPDAYGCNADVRAEGCEVRDDVEAEGFPYSGCPLWELKDGTP
jgi:hypothetical protein